MTSSQLANRLRALAETPAPEPDPAFVARLGDDLRMMDQVPVLSERATSPAHRPWFRVMTVAVPAMAALAAAVFVLRPAPDRPHRVTTAGPGVTAPSQIEAGNPAPVQTSVAPPSAATHTAAVPATTVPPAQTPSSVPGRHLVVPGIDTTPTSTVTSEPPHTTTSTTTPATGVETLTLTCGAGTSGGSPAVSCGWSHSTSPAFASYRLSREKPGTNRMVVFTTTSPTVTGYVDHDVQTGSSYYYWIEALDSAGNVIGRSQPSNVSCC